jgi:hypothetical protein
VAVRLAHGRAAEARVAQPHDLRGARVESIEREVGHVA